MAKSLGLSRKQSLDNLGATNSGARTVQKQLTGYDSFGCRLCNRLTKHQLMGDGASNQHEKTNLQIIQIDPNERCREPKGCLAKRFTACDRVKPCIYQKSLKW